jgi:hypothetical protein
MAEIEDIIDKTQWLPEKAPVVLPERRGSVVGVEGERGGKEYRSLARPLETYVAKGQITGAQYRAGLRLNALWEKTSQSPYSQVQYRDQEGGARAMSFVPTGFGAVEYRTAIDAVGGAKARLIVFGVCCEDRFATNCLPTLTRRTAERQGMAYLREGLDALARHFKAQRDRDEDNSCATGG